MMSVADEIAKLDALQQSGAITGEEYEKLKAALLEKQVSGSPDAVHISIPSFDVNNWAQEYEKSPRAAPYSFEMMP